MSTRDKTRDKLLSSMRKTKAVTSDQPASKVAHADTAAPVSGKPARKTRARKKKVASATTKAATGLPSSRAVPVSDPYQSRGRIWPD